MYILYYVIYGIIMLSKEVGMKVLILFLILFICLGAMPLFAADESGDKSDSVFQKMGDGICKMGKSESGEKGTLTESFQKSSDYIKESSPRARNLSLRGNKKEIMKRRGMCK